MASTPGLRKPAFCLALPSPPPCASMCNQSKTKINERARTATHRQVLAVQQGGQLQAIHSLSRRVQGQAGDDVI